MAVNLPPLIAMDAGGEGDATHYGRSGVNEGETDIQVLEIPGVAVFAVRIETDAQVGDRG